MSDKLKAIFEQNTSTASAEGSLTGKGGLPKRRLSFMVDHRVTTGIFDEDFEITLCSLSVAQELAASRNVQQGGGMDLLHGLALKSIEKYEGEVIDRPEQREWLWDALGQGGRQIVLAKLAALGGPIEEAVKKADETLKVE